MVDVGEYWTNLIVASINPYFWLRLCTKQESGGRKTSHSMVDVGEYWINLIVASIDPY
jgi:hypothetical protein